MVILAFILLVLVGVVSFINTELMTINLYFMALSIPMWGIFITFLLIGMLIAALFATSKGARNRQVIKNKNKEIERTENEKTDAIERVNTEKEEALERMKLEKKEAVEQSRKESDLQLELQNREAEIQKLESQLAQDDEPIIVTEEPPPQTREQNSSVRKHDRGNFVEEEQITEYKVDPSNENQEID